MAEQQMRTPECPTCGGEISDKRLAEELRQERIRAAASDMLEVLQWISEIADKNYEQDETLRSNGARTLARISDRARAAIVKATGSTK